MAKGDKLTHNQHYIPQVYLKGFSESNNSVFFFNLTSCENSRMAVPVKTICFKHDLYEAKNEQGDYLLANHIEKILANLERMFSKYRTKLENKAFNKENYRTNCFLTHDEKIFWITYLSVQIMRSPKVLSIAKSFCKENLLGSIEVCKAENIALSYCLPFFTELSVESISALNTFLDPMLNMSFNIGVIQGNEKLFTSDNPIYILANWPCKEYEKIIFPITSKLCLFMYGRKYKKIYKKNCLIPIGEEMLKEINWSIAYRADEMIFSANRLSKKQKEDICKIHQQRIEDDKKLLDDSIFNRKRKVFLR